MGFIKVNDKNNFVKFTKTFPSNLTTAVDNYMYNTANKYRNNVIRAMKTTQRDLTKGYRRGNKIHYPSKAGHPPAVDSGNLIAKQFVNKIKNGAQFYVFGAPYVQWLEYPNDKTKRRPVYENELKKLTIERDISNIIKGIE